MIFYKTVLQTFFISRLIRCKIMILLQNYKKGNYLHLGYQLQAKCQHHNPHHFVFAIYNWLDQHPTNKLVICLKHYLREENMRQIMVQIIHGYPYTFEETYSQQNLLDPLTSLWTTLSIQMLELLLIVLPHSCIFFQTYKNINLTYRTQEVSRHIDIGNKCKTI